MESVLPTQLKNASDIREILKEVEVEFTLEDGSVFKTLLVYLPIDDGASDHTEFLDHVKEGLLYHFVFSYKEIEKKLGIQGDDDAAEKLLDKAIRKLSKKTAHGELGELLLFTLLDIYFNAPKILSKVSYKTNRKMPVFGADAVHGQFNNGKFKLYLGESKLYTDFTKASTAATKSITTAIGKYEEEFDLLDSFMDFEGITEELESALLEILDPFSDTDLNELICSPCFIGFAEPELIAGAPNEEEFVKSYVDQADIYVKDFIKKAKKLNIDMEETALLMLPYSCVDKFVEDFVEHIGIKA